MAGKNKRMRRWDIPEHKRVLKKEYPLARTGECCETDTKEIMKGTDYRLRIAERQFAEMLANWDNVDEELKRDPMVIRMYELAERVTKQRRMAMNPTKVENQLSGDVSRPIVIVNNQEDVNVLNHIIQNSQISKEEDEEET